MEEKDSANEVSWFTRTLAVGVINSLLECFVMFRLSGESRCVDSLLPQSDQDISGVGAPELRSSNTGMSVSENWGGGGISAGER